MSRLFTLHMVKWILLGYVRREGGEELFGLAKGVDRWSGERERTKEWFNWIEREERANEIGNDHLFTVCHLLSLLLLPAVLGPISPFWPHHA